MGSSSILVAWRCVTLVMCCVCLSQAQYAEVNENIPDNQHYEFEVYPDPEGHKPAPLPANRIKPTYRNDPYSTHWNAYVPFYPFALPFRSVSKHRQSLRHSFYPKQTYKSTIAQKQKTSGTLQPIKTYKAVESSSATLKPLTVKVVRMVKSVNSELKMETVAETGGPDRKLSVDDP